MYKREGDFCHFINKTMFFFFYKLLFSFSKHRKISFHFLYPFLYPFLKIIKNPFRMFYQSAKSFPAPTNNIQRSSSISTVYHRIQSIILSGGTFSTMRLRIQYGGSILFRGQPLPVLPWKGKKRRLLVS